MVSIYDVLKASKGIHVEDSFAELWGRKMRGGYTVKTLTGVPPFTFTADGEPLIDWSMSGQVEGVGEKTSNWFDAATAYGSMYSDGVLTGDANVLTRMQNKFTADMVGNPVTIAITANQVPVSRVYIRCSISGSNYDSNAVAGGRTGRMTVTVTPTSTDDHWRITFGTGSGTLTLSDIMLNTGSFPLPYEPHGVKIPITCGGQTTNIYLDAPLMDGETITKTSTGVEIPTTDGSNTLSVGTTVQPSSMSITFMGK